MCGVASSGEHRRSREAGDVIFAARTNRPSLDWRCDVGVVCWARHRTRWRSTTTATDFGWRKRQRHRRYRRRWRLDTPASERTVNRVLEPKSAQLHRRRKRLSDRRHSVSGGRGAGDWRRMARLVHDERWRAQLEDPTATRVSSGFVYGRSELSFAGLWRRRRSDHSTGHERALLLRRAGLRSRRGRWQRDLRRSLHRQQQPGGNRRRADRLPRCLDCSSYWCGANRRAPPGGRSEGLDASRATRGAGQQEAKTQRARRRRTGGRADGRQTVDGRRHSASRSADVHNRRRQHWCSATDVSRRARLHGVRAFRWPR